MSYHNSCSHFKLRFLPWPKPCPQEQHSPFECDGELKLDSVIATNAGQAALMPDASLQPFATPPMNAAVRHNSRYYLEVWQRSLIKTNCQYTIVLSTDFSSSEKAAIRHKRQLHRTCEYIHLRDPEFVKALYLHFRLNCHDDMDEYLHGQRPSGSQIPASASIETTSCSSLPSDVFLKKAIGP